MASSWELIKQGAEAKVYRGKFYGAPAILKERFHKKYRVPSLDKKLSSRRTSQEARSMSRCLKLGVRAPAVYHVDLEKRHIYMEDVTLGLVLKEYLNRLDPVSHSDALENVMKTVGGVIAAIHDGDLIHGDLTTSNMIYDETESNLTLIDFGLSFVSSLAEDKGVDLYVLERALLSTHPDTERLFIILLDSYRAASKNGDSVIAKLDEVRMRGRKRLMVG